MGAENGHRWPRSVVVNDLSVARTYGQQYDGVKLLVMHNPIGAPSPRVRAACVSLVEG